MFEFLKAHNSEQLRQRLIVLEAKSLDAEAWCVEARSEGGKRRLKQLHAELDALRTSYRMIPASEPAALIVLAGIQGEERQLLSIIGRMENSEKFKKGIDEERRAVVSIISYKDSDRKSRPNEIAPDDEGRTGKGRQAAK